MNENEDKQVSDVPLISHAPRKKGPNNVLTLFILFLMIGGVTAGTLILLDPWAREPDTHVTQWPEYGEHNPFEGSSDDYDAAVEHMRELADALMRYREDFGGNLNWPANLDELAYTGLIDEGYDRTGVLSRKPIVYNAEMPMGRDPARWVIAHDTEIGWQRRQNSRYAVRGPRASVVILGDGSVKLLEGPEIERYGGLNVDLDTTN